MLFELVLGFLYLIKYLLLQYVLDVSLDLFSVVLCLN